MTPEALSKFLHTLVRHRLMFSTMIWGAPGIGKSSIVAQTAAEHKMELIDLRLSQLAPTDLRGLPVAADGVSRWYPPEFLPREGRGILFLDELNLAPPAMQGMAQQLILDRKVGSYCYDDQTRVMTKQGLKFFRELIDDDELMTLNSTTDMVEFHRPSQHIQLAYKGDMLHFQGESLSLCVSPDHNMLVRADVEKEYHFRKASELADQRYVCRYRVKRAGGWPGTDSMEITNPLSVQELKRAIRDEQIVDIPDEVKQFPRPALSSFFDAVLMEDETGARRIVTASSRLRDDYCEIAIKLGYGVTFTWREETDNAKFEGGAWVIDISQTLNPEAEIKKIEHVPYDSNIYCVTVQNHILMVERDGKLAWCGNCVPENWFVWAAGNRKEDRAAVFDMPAPLANRFIHLTVESHFESFKFYALGHDVHEHIMAFLSFRPALLHKLDPQQPAWPSPRSWMIANQLYKVGLDIAHVVGTGAAAEFTAFLKLYSQLPNVEAILQGNGKDVGFPKEPSLRYALTVALTMRATSLQESYQAFLWMASNAGNEWIQLFATDLFRQALARNERGRLAILAQRDPRLQQMLVEYMAMVEGRDG